MRKLIKSSFCGSKASFGRLDGDPFNDSLDKSCLLRKELMINLIRDEALLSGMLSFTEDSYAIELIIGLKLF